MKLIKRPTVSAYLRSLLALIIIGLSLITAPTTKASFHLMQIDEVIGGVNGDTSVQAIELRMRAGGQTFLSGAAKLIAVDAAGANPVTLINFGSNVAIGNLGSAILISSSNFKNFTPSPGTFVNDFTLTNLSPSSYLNAGRLLYEDSSNNILWSLAFGGASYTGPTNGETTNGVVDPGKFGGPLPSNSLRALLYQGTASGQNTNNATDYAVTSGAATFTNNAGTSFTVVPEPSSLILVAIALAMAAAKSRLAMRVMRKRQ